MTNSIRIPVSIGELWDKYTILQIKLEKIKDASKLVYIQTELDALDKWMNNYEYKNHSLFLQLKQINHSLWNIEDSLREKERKQMFDNEFIDLARSVYYTNDKRAEIKKNINITFHSLFHEVKDYQNYKG